MTTTKPITPDHIFEMTGASAPSLAPDGETLVITKQTIRRETMETISVLMISQRSVTGQFAEFTELTSGPSDSTPVFSPDGQTIAFARKTENGHKQLWIVSVSGGPAKQLTQLENGLVDNLESGPQFDWSPDSDKLAFIAEVNEDDSTDVRVVNRIRYRHDFRGWIGNTFRQLFTIDLPTGEIRQVTTGEGDAISPRWAPDGTRIAYISDALAERDYTNHEAAFVVSPLGGEPEDWSGGLPYVWSIAWSPDSTKLASIGCHDPEMWDPRSAWMYILEPGSQARQVTNGEYTPVRECGLNWRTDSLLYIGARWGQYYVRKLNPETEVDKTITGGSVQYDSLTIEAAGQSAIAIEQSPTTYADVCHIELESGNRTVIASDNSEYLASHRPAKLEKFVLKRSGLEIESRVLFPPEFDSSKQYPMILDIHGGPNGRFADNFDPVQQVMTSAGYIVLAVNPRGSSTYGPEFTKSVLGDWGGEDFLDIMAAVDKLSEKPYVNPDRLAVHGFSYGGFMSSWIIGHDTRFKAALVGAMCANLHSMYGTSDIGTSFGELNWGGIYTEARDKFLYHSPITYAPNVDTPVLLLHGEDDFRCPIEQSEQYFVALRRLGKEVEFVRFPNSSHTFRKSGHPKMRIEYFTRVLSWLDKYV